ncbi:MAG: alpha/beta hydrolase [Rhodococcus sp. (in: high G+C Gram-positive bacteria)]|uniref:alpha/beta fold hydrolase n=1 Tax=Rhodococcus sp. TaxID=1831 RepID=UPI002ADA5D50|nr:alpha/beta hydrolase [Rhodococcus sp. (in: high G+C Gram-positive bacteria)]
MTETGYASVGSQKVHYRRVGDSSELPWVFLHGIGEDSSSWTLQQEALAQYVPTYAIDVRGHGATELGDAAENLDQLAEDLLGFLEVVGPSVCVGFSMGGTIVLSAAARQKTDLIRHAIGVCTSSMVGERAAAQFREIAASIDRGGQVAARSAVDRFLTESVPNPPSDWEAQKIARFAAVGDGRGYANAARAMASLREMPLTPQLSAIVCPVDILVGENDRACPLKAAEIIAGAVSDSRLHSLPGVGHFVGVENPSLLTSTLLQMQ